MAKNTTPAKTTPAKGAKVAAKPSAAAKRVVTLRDKGGKPHTGASWAAIGKSLTPPVSPATARRMYDSVKGAGAHHGLLPGKGGRRQAS